MDFDVENFLYEIILMAIKIVFLAFLNVSLEFNEISN